MTRRSILATIAIGVAGFVAAGVWVSRQMFTPHFSITENENGIALHSLRLGEYYTPVQELTIVDERGSVVARFVAKTEQSMMHTVTVAIGRNEFKDLYLDGYSIEGIEYEFLVDVVYKAHVRWPSREAELRFSLKKKRPNQALQTTSVTRSEFGKVPVFDRQRRGV